MRRIDYLLGVKGSPKRNLVVFFSLTYLSYSVIYISRKVFSIAKPFIKVDASLYPPVDSHALGLIDTMFLGSYAVFQVLLPSLAPRIGTKKLLVVCFIVAAVFCHLFGIAREPAQFSLCWLIEGIAHAPVFALLLDVLTPHLPVASKSTYLGLWSTCQQLGSVLSTLFSAYICGHYGWRNAFLFAAVLTLLNASALYLWLPSDTAMKPSKSEAGIELHRLDAEAPTEPVLPPATLLETFHVTNIVHCSFAYFTTKLTRYGLLFWLPYFLTEHFGLSPEPAGYASILFDLGGIVGAVFAGRVADEYFGKRCLTVAMLAMVTSCFCLFVLAFFCTLPVASPYVTQLVLSVVIVTGFFIAGADTLLGASSPSVVLERYKLSGASDGKPSPALTTAAGIVNGLGSFGGTLQGILCPLITQTWGWQGFFFFLAVSGLIGAVALVPSVRIDYITRGITS
ncbi:MAG: uncharacterized protein KVP18_002258 [Porospora cf. gigantea A]|uniref:uncharacterized protein n=2 Tax=Porospora cf. gigantea A TaxID=2853593 RepID=UPI003559E6A3|nr:MAG: hypothetical protein KVP18_002258 [Porospora cf. gigantea A]